MNQVIAKFPTDKGSAKNAFSSRRPPNNPELPADYIADMEESFRSWRDELEDYAAHLRSLDRKRLNGVAPVPNRKIYLCKQARPQKSLLAPKS
jgi:hypothetical protein